MNAFNDNAECGRYDMLKIIRYDKATYVFPEFRWRTAKWALVGYFKVFSYSSVIGYSYAYDLIAAADTKAELIMQCAVRGIEYAEV